MPSLFAAVFFALPASAPAVRLLLAAHVLAGGTALLAGLVPMLSRKGGRWHVGAGRVYTACMVGVAATAGLLCAVQPITQGRLLLTGIAVFSFYLSFSGWRAARRRSVQLPAAEVVLAGAALAVGLAMLAVGLYLGAVLFAFFGGLTCVFAGLDTWHGVRRARPLPGPTMWLLRHFTRMAGSYISAATAFVVVNLGRWLPADAPAWAGLAGWMAPTLIGGLLIFRTVRRYRRPGRPALGPVPLAVLALLAWTAPAAAQVPNRLAGTITDTTGQPLPYATAAIVGQGVGTVADAQGRFRLALPTSVAPADTLRFALLGYASRSFVVGTLAPAPLTVALRPAAVDLAAVTVRARRLDTLRIGNPHARTRLQTNFALGTGPNLNVGSEIGRVFQLPKAGAWLDAFEFVLSANDFDTVQLRDGLPARPLLRHPLYRQLTTPGARRVRLSLREEDLFVAGAVVVAEEWIGPLAPGPGAGPAPAHARLRHPPLPLRGRQPLETLPQHEHRHATNGAEASLERVPRSAASAA